MREDQARTRDNRAMRILARLTAGNYSVPAGFPAGLSWNLPENPQVVRNRASGRPDLAKYEAPWGPLGMCGLAIAANPDLASLVAGDLPERDCERKEAPVTIQPWLANSCRTCGKTRRWQE